MVFVYVRDNCFLMGDVCWFKSYGVLFMIFWRMEVVIYCFYVIFVVFINVLVIFKFFCFFCLKKYSVVVCWKDLSLLRWNIILWNFKVFG